MKLWRADAKEPNYPGPAAALVLGSPPYPGKFSRYGLPERSNWAAWMLDITKVMLDIAPTVIWVADNRVKDGRYHPDCERLLVGADNLGIPLLRPAIWYKNAAPSGGWLSHTYEHILGFGTTPTLNTSDVSELAKYNSGGRFRQRKWDGERPDVTGTDYSRSPFRRPRDVLEINVQGTVAGTEPGSSIPTATGHEAPYNPELPAFFIKLLTNPGDIIYDPFAGSGTTCRVAEALGRIGYGSDIRYSAPGTP